MANLSILYLLGQSVVYFLILVFIEFRTDIAGSCKHLARSIANRDIYDNYIGINEDEDVTQERTRVKNNKIKDVVTINNLTKQWGKKGPLAVNHLSLGIPQNECFGLLGENGAGKSTTLSILTGLFHPSSGQAYLNGYDVVTQTNKVRESLGYCPQFDALVDMLTGREHLYLYASIKGVKPDLIKQTVNAFISMMQIEEYADKLTMGYSGGNKRKLSLAIALIGNPPILFLDEVKIFMIKFYFIFIIYYFW